MRVGVWTKGSARRERRARAMELLARVGLKGRESHTPAQLSGGQQQRVGIARAIAIEPEVILFDEPTSALDVSVQRQVVEEMLLVRRTFGTAIVIVTHNIGVIGAMADRVLVMKDGKMVEYGDVKQVLERPRELYTQALMAAVPKLRR